MDYDRNEDRDWDRNGDWDQDRHWTRIRTDIGAGLGQELGQKPRNFTQKNLEQFLFVMKNHYILKTELN